MPTLPQSKLTRPLPFIPAVLNKCSQNTAAMISKEDQRSLMKIECTRGCNPRQCYNRLQEACRERALLYCTVASWVKAFKGRQNVTDMPWPGHPAVREEDVQTMNSLVMADRNVTIGELTNDAGLAPLTVLKILI